MTVADKIVSAAGDRPRLATPGAVLLLVGLALLWWGTGIFRGESGSGRTFRMTGPIAKTPTSTDNTTPNAGAGGQKIR